MNPLPLGTRVWLAAGVSDMRRGMDSLAAQVTDHAGTKSVLGSRGHLKLLDPYIGKLGLAEVHDATLAPFVKMRLQTVSATTVRRSLEVVRRILNLAARKWREEDGSPWLSTAPPLLSMPKGPVRNPYPLSWEEQTRLFARLPQHLARMALVKVNTGLREQEVVQLRWAWEQRVPELDVTVFVIPARFGGRRRNSGVKNGEDRLVVLNETAKAVIDACRGEHPEFVFSYRGEPVEVHEQQRVAEGAQGNRLAWGACTRSQAYLRPPIEGRRCTAGDSPGAARSQVGRYHHALQRTGDGGAD
jgi:integrase